MRSEDEEERMKRWRITEEPGPEAGLFGSSC
jgi:hypothetical protein